MTADEARAYLDGLSFHRGRRGDTSFMHPDFAIKLATAIQQARAQGIMVSLLSGYREASDHPSSYDEKGWSSHEYGLAADLSGIGTPGSATAARWQKIAAANGISNPYGIDNPTEFNHWQVGPKLETNAPLLNALVAGKRTGDPTKMWAAFDPNAVANTVNTGTAGPIAAAPDNRSLFFNAFVKAGMSPQQALGALWSMGGESHPNIQTDAYNPNDPGGAFGAAQWTQERRFGLEKYAASLGKRATDPQVQADYLVQGELLGKLPQYAIYQKGVWDAITQAKTPEDASRIWTTMLERPANASARAEERIRAGAAVGSIDANGNFVPGTAAAAGPPGAGPPLAGAGTGAGGPPAAEPPSQLAQIGSALGSALSGLVGGNSGLTGSTGGSYLDASMDQPPIRTLAQGADFTAPPASPVPANIAGGAGSTPIGTQLGALAAVPGDPMLENPNIAPSITSGAPSMTAMLPGVGYTGGMGSLLNARNGGANLMNPFIQPTRVS